VGREGQRLFLYTQVYNFVIELLTQNFSLGIKMVEETRGRDFPGSAASNILFSKFVYSERVPDTRFSTSGFFFIEHLILGS
jgi:hypothetical protein